MKRVNWFTIVPPVIVLLLVLVPSAYSQAVSGPASDYSGGPKDRIEVALHADGAPDLGGVATLTFDATPFIQAPEMEIHWVIPQGVELLGDEFETMSTVPAHQTVTSQRQLRFPSSGTYKVIVAASYSPTQGVEFHASGVLFFTIGERFSRVSDKDPDARSPMGSRMEGEITTSAHLGNEITATNDDPCFSVSGVVYRIDRMPNKDGYDPPENIPVPNALIEISEEDLLFDDTYAELITNQNGGFSYAFCDDDGIFDDELEIYVQLEAELYSGGHFVAEVQDISYIDEVYEFNSWVVSSEGGAITFNLLLNEEQSAIFNMAQAAFDAWSFWNASGGEYYGDSIFDDEAEIHWEPGYGEDESYYYSFWEEITIADDPSDPDQWDESVIMHEWTHMADDYYSCDGNPGGDHAWDEFLSPELAWGEGYPDYYQSVVRDNTGYTLGNYYIDGDPGGAFDLNLENFHANHEDLVSTLNEIAIAAALWDLQDLPADDQDKVTVGHAAIQKVFTSGWFEYHDECDFDGYMKVWATHNQVNQLIAAAIHQNTGYTLLPASLLRQASSNTQSPQSFGSAPEYIWWNQLTYLVDNSMSMLGNKFDAVKVVLEEAINDLGVEPEGTEFMLTTFNNTGFTIQEVFAGQFFPETLTPVVNSLTTSSATDLLCKVNGLNSLIQAIDEQEGGDVWLFTDGDDNQSFVTAEIASRFLNDREVRASIAQLGLCSTTQALSEEDLQAQRQLQGAAEVLLGMAAEGTPGGVVPYLLTAMNSGGQFLFVDSSQVEHAADILRAQITHSAGAGKWSDYVSDYTTYRYDELASWEYNWIDATTNITSCITPQSNDYVTVNLPAGFSYYNTRGVMTAHAYENGYLTLGNNFGNQPNNTTLPNSAPPNNVLYPFWDDLDWFLLCEAGADSPAGCGLTGYICSKQDGDWFAIEWENFYATTPGEYNIFEVLLNSTTKEIRYQYDTVPEGTGGATIGLENASGTHAVQISYNDVSGASAGMGYKFNLAPPQPTKTYTVTVDSMMSGVGFLLTGYSGSFEPLVVRYPNGTLVDCNDTANVLCLDLGLVQYVQADVDYRYGVWEAVVDAGPTGEGTFSFTSFAASELSPSLISLHNFSTADTPTIVVDLGAVIAGQQITGWFQKPDGSAFGNQFPLFDDGAHGDGQANDGIFGSSPFTPAAAGSAYLHMKGVLDGVNFVRSIQVPFTFQPVDITSLGDGDNYGGATTLQFSMVNHDTHNHWFEINYHLPEGWYLTGVPVLNKVLLTPGVPFLLSVDVYMAPGSTNDLPSGTSGQVTISVTEVEKGQIYDSASATVTRRRPPAEIRIFNPTPSLRPNGDSAIIEIHVFDEQGVIVADGTEVQLTASLGSISPAPGTTQNGSFMATFTSGPSLGTATISAQAGGATADTTIEISLPLPAEIELTSSRDQLPPDGSSTATLTAILRDQWGDPISNQMVSIGVSGDGQLATIDGGEVVTGMTDAQGQFQATLTSGMEAGDAFLRAELLLQTYAAQAYESSIDDSVLIKIKWPTLYLPIVNR